MTKEKVQLQSSNQRCLLASNQQTSNHRQVRAGLHIHNQRRHMLQYTYYIDNLAMHISATNNQYHTNMCWLVAVAAPGTHRLMADSTVYLGRKITPSM